MNRKLLAILLVVLGQQAYAAETAAKRVSLPYSYDEAGLRITVQEVTPATRTHGLMVPTGYVQWTVNFRYENLLNTDWEPPLKGYGIGHCAGLVSFKLKTDTGNIYKPRFVGGSPFCLQLKPKAVFTGQELYIFEIQRDEKLSELWGYDLVRGSSKKHLKYIFELKSGKMD